LDNTANIDTFFKEKDYGRDCDDYARAWLTWGVANGFDCQEVIVTTKKHLAESAHVICILSKENKYWLCNYEYYGSFDTFDDALDYMKQFPSYKDGFIYSMGIKEDKHE